MQKWRGKMNLTNEDKIAILKRLKAQWDKPVADLFSPYAHFFNTSCVLCQIYKENRVNCHLCWDEILSLFGQEKEELLLTLVC